MKQSLPMKQALARAALLGLCLCALAGCKKRTTDAIAVIPKGTTHEFWKSVHAGAEQVGKELGVKIIWKGPRASRDSSTPWPPTRRSRS